MKETFRQVAIQLEAEMDALCAIFRREQVRSFLEIGSKWGGSLWRLAHAMPRGARVVSVDLDQNGRSLSLCIKALRVEGYDAHLIRGNSVDRHIVKQAAFLGPFDALFIDANHKEPYVRQDWQNYGPLARIVAFHDIGWQQKPGESPTRILGVGNVWREIKHDYRHEEIILDPAKAEYGIGVLWTRDT